MRDLVCVSPRSNPHAFCWSGASALMLINGSLGYRGDLIVVGVPKGSVWSLSLSDVPIVRAPHSNIGLHNFSGSNYQPVNPPAEPKPVSDNAAALERQMRPRQINDTKAQRRQ